MGQPTPSPLSHLSVDRRSVFRLGALGGGGLVAAWALGAEDVVRGVAGSSSAAAAAETVTGCATLTKEETQGPYWIEEKLNRADIRSDVDTGVVQAGVPLTFTLTVLDAGDSCAPQPGAFVDVWHCNAQGLYSAVSTAGNQGQSEYDYLRGYQVTDSAGKVTFTTVYPGWYAGRTTHIHFRVRTTLSDSSTVNFTSQLYFAESTSSEVYATSAYQRSGSRTTTNANDGLYDASLVMPLSGSSTAGYTGAFTVNLDFGGEDGAGTTASTSSTGSTGTSATDTVVDASLDAAWVARGRFGRRYLRVQTTNAERVTPLVRLVRGDDVLASRRYGWWVPGTRRRAVVVPPGVRRGAATAMARFTDDAGHTKIATLPVVVPRRGH